MKLYDTIIIGAGQAGLAAGYYAKKESLDFLILESKEVGGSWNEYYDSLTLFTPKEYSALPGMRFPGEKGEYPTRSEMAAYLKEYATRMQLPIQTQSTVHSVQKEHNEFVLETSKGEFRAKSVVVCSGPFNEPYIPNISGKELYKGNIVHTHAYKNPELFKGKKVVVVGAGASAVQIAVELSQVTDVVLAMRHKPTFWPRTLLGKDITFWSKYTIDLVRVNQKGSIVIDTKEGKYKKALKENHPPQKPMFKALYENGVVWANDEREAFDVIIFGTGYKPSFPFLKGLGAFEVRKPIPGLFFLGQPNQRTYASATVRGAGRDGSVIIRRLKRYLKST